MVIASSLGSGLVSMPLANILQKVRSYDAISMILLVERAAVLACVCLLISLNDGSLPQILQESRVFNGTGPSLNSDWDKVLQEGSFEKPDKISHQWKFSLTMLFVVALCSLASVCRNATLVLVGKTWVEIVASSPFNVSERVNLIYERPRYNRPPSLSADGLASGMGSNRVSSLESDDGESDGDGFNPLVSNRLMENRKRSITDLISEFDNTRVCSRIIGPVIAGFILVSYCIMSKLGSHSDDTGYKSESRRPSY